MFRLLLLLIAALSANAETVYKTVENGVPTFSDAPPAAGVNAEVFTLVTPPPAEDGLLEERLTAMRESTDRMAADRMAREKHRAEIRALRAPEPEVIQPAEPVAAWTGGYNYWPSYGYPLRPRPPYLPGRPRPTPLPIAEPPPGWSVITGGNSQLMRPIVRSRR